MPERGNLVDVIASRRALRRLVAACDGDPIDAALERAEVAAYHHGPAERSLQLLGTTSFGVEPAALDGWCAAAWWGAAASRIST